MQRLAVLALAALLPACATVVEGTSDTATLSTTPAGATCTVDRDGERVGTVSATPASLRLSKSRHDLNVTCTKEGYQPATATASSRFTGATLALQLRLPCRLMSAAIFARSPWLGWPE